MKRQRSSGDSFDAADFDMNTIWLNQALDRTATLAGPARGWRGIGAA
jgi:hypothetical protein